MNKKEEKKKLDYSLIPHEWNKWLTQILEVGVEKHGEGTWKTHDRKDLLRKLMRHTQEYREGKSIDEDKTFVLAKVAFHSLAILWQIENEKFEKCTAKLLEDIHNA